MSSDMSSSTAEQEHDPEVASIDDEFDNMGKSYSG